ncbi:MAG TPA: TldD/PmbA family protein [Fibrobacteria bacterium]|nr:TldD/PmbA family protein [Fibrobacteria bacterium]
MDASRAARILDLARSRGADFAELFVEETRFSSLALRDRKIESASAGTEFGIGARMIFGSQVLYGHTSREDEESLARLVEDLAAARPRSGAHLDLGAPIRGKAGYGADLAGVAHPHDAALDGRLDAVRLADQTARAVSPKVAQVSATVLHRHSRIAIFNSEGLDVADERVWSRMTVAVVAEDGGRRQTGSESPGQRRGLEFLTDLDVRKLSTLAADRAVRMLSASPAPAGEMPVLIGNGFGGVIFHEACGHPLETEALRRKATPFAGRIGEAIAQPCLTAIDDGTIPGAWGSIAVDDEGSPAQRTVLIENGVLRTFLSDRVGAAECGVPRSGSARRENYRYAPVARMRNTFIAAGDSAVEEMLASMGDGLWAVRMGGGSVNPATGEFNFAVEEGYLVRGGKVTEPVRGATLTGKGHEILPRIRMVGSDLEFAPGTCGASSGLVPVCVGQPSILVDPILVGGKA